MRQEDTDWDPLFLDPFWGVGCRLSQVPWRRSDLFQWALQRLLFIALGLDRVVWDRLSPDAWKKAPQ